MACICALARKASASFTKSTEQSCFLLATTKSRSSASTPRRRFGMLPTNLLNRYAAACDYPGVLDEVMVEEQLRRYLRALNVDRKIERLRPGWTLANYPSLEKYGIEIAQQIYASAARDA